VAQLVVLPPSDEGVDETADAPPHHWLMHLPDEHSPRTPVAPLSGQTTVHGHMSGAPPQLWTTLAPFGRGQTGSPAESPMSSDKLASAPGIPPPCSGVPALLAAPPPLFEAPAEVRPSPLDAAALEPLACVDPAEAFPELPSEFAPDVSPGLHPLRINATHAPDVAMPFMLDNAHSSALTHRVPMRFGNAKL
jgi:hypothetical protein